MQIMVYLDFMEVPEMFMVIMGIVGSAPKFFIALLNILLTVFFNLLNQTYLCSHHLLGTELPEVQDFRLCHIVLSCGEQRGTYT